MHINDLKYFNQLCIKKSFSKVAKYYDISQPAVSNSLKRLERHFDTTLLIRGNSQKELLITSAGEQLNKHIESIINELQSAEREIVRMNRKSMMLGLSPIIGNIYFTKIAKQIKESSLTRDIITYEAGSNDLEKALITGKLDIALIGSIQKDQNDLLTFLNFAESKFCVFISKDNPLSSRTGIYFSELKDQAFVMFNSSFVHTQALKAFAKNAHFLPKVLFTSIDVNFLMNMVSENVGVTILADIVKPNRPDIVKIPILDDKQPHFYASIAYRSNHLLTESQSSLLEIIKTKL